MVEQRGKERQNTQKEKKLDGHDMTFNAKTWKTLVALLGSLNVEEFIIQYVKNGDGSPYIRAGVVDIAHVSMMELRIPTFCEGLNSCVFSTDLYMRLETAKIVATQAVEGTLVRLYSKPGELTGDYLTHIGVKSKGKKAWRSVKLVEQWGSNDLAMFTNPRIPDLKKYLTDRWTFSVTDMAPLFRRGRHASSNEQVRLRRDEEDEDRIQVSYGGPVGVEFNVGEEHTKLDDKGEFKKASFDFGFMTRVMKAARTVERKARLYVSLGTDNPMKLSGKLGDVEFDYHLAPRVEGD